MLIHSAMLYGGTPAETIIDRKADSCRGAGLEDDKLETELGCLAGVKSPLCKGYKSRRRRSPSPRIAVCCGRIMSAISQARAPRAEEDLHQQTTRADFQRNAPEATGQYALELRARHDCATMSPG